MTIVTMTAVTTAEMAVAVETVIVRITAASEETREITKPIFAARLTRAAAVPMKGKMR